MSKGSMLKLFEKTGVDGLSGPSHCRDSFIVSQDVFYSGRTSNRPVREPRSEGLVKLIGGPLPGPLGHPAAFAAASRARRSTVEAAGKQAGTQTCRRVNA
jgi:hypothetical protein